MRLIPKSAREGRLAAAGGTLNACANASISFPGDLIYPVNPSRDSLDSARVPPGGANVVRGMMMKRKTRGHATDVDAHVGERLRSMREERGLSQEALGQRVDVSFQQIQKYERGANRVGASRLYEFAQVFSVPVETFFNGLPSDTKDDAEARATVSQLSQFARSKEGGELMSAFASIKDVKARRQILQLIRTLAPSEED